MSGMGYDLTLHPPLVIAKRKYRMIDLKAKLMTDNKVITHKVLGITRGSVLSQKMINGVNDGPVSSKWTESWLTDRLKSGDATIVDGTTDTVQFKSTARPTTEELMKELGL